MNPFELIKNLKNIQTNMKDMQEKMINITAIGTSGGDMVRITLNGQMEVTDISLTPEVVDPNDILTLQDLIKAAYSDALIKIRDKLKEEMISSGDGIPPEFMGV